MKKKLCLLLTAVVLLTIALFIDKHTNSKYYIDTQKSKLKAYIVLKLGKEPRDFCIDEKGGFYIAYKSKIEYINASGKSKKLVSGNNYDIYSMEYSKGTLYFSSCSSIYFLNEEGAEPKALIDGIPNLGDYKKVNLLIKDDSLYFTVGAATNSGVVGSDNTWLKSNQNFYDYTPFDITLIGSNFGSENTGSFVPYKSQNRLGQIISARNMGTSSVYALNLKNRKLTNEAWGIRNIVSIDSLSSGKIFFASGGMENRGLRPVFGDTDYIYELKQGTWYGWPDYSGGDPIDSPRFMHGDKKTLQIMQAHPTENVPAPFYQNKNLSSISSMAVDKDGTFEEKDCIYFYDKRDNTVYKLMEQGAAFSYIILDKGTDISRMRIKGKGMYMLDVNGRALFYLKH